MEVAFGVIDSNFMSEPSQRQLFVIGFFRSGTSLLYSFLNLHSQIKLLYEADLLGNSLITVSARSGPKWWERLDFYNSCIQRHHLEVQPSWNNVRNRREAADILYQQYAGTERRYIGEKSPSYYNCLPLLARMYPQARFIVIWRDPAAVISSIIAAGKKDYFFRNPSLRLRSLIGLEKMQADVLSLRAQGVPVFDLCCEDLVADPESKLRPICDFLELQYEPGMLELEKADCSMFPPGEHQDKARSGRVNREIRQGAGLENKLFAKVRRYLGRWKKKFQDTLATRRYWPDAAVNPTCPAEVSLDRLYCKVHCFYSEQCIPVIYGIFPLAGLAFYRHLRGPIFLSESSHTSQSRAVCKGALTTTKISVITPSYKQLSWLKLCIASIADQRGVEVEHIIQDAQSGPELSDWVHKHSKAHLYVEADSGMYDAINRGFARATGDIVCWLNSDEQYLEGALVTVARYFEAHPEVDVLFADALLVGNTGTLLSYRKAIFPRRWPHSAFPFEYSFLCNVRAPLCSGAGLYTGYPMEGDCRCRVGCRFSEGWNSMAVLNEPLAIFTITDKNLGQSSLALTETEIWQREISPFIRGLRLGFILKHRFLKFIKGAYWPRSFTTRFYILGNSDERATRTVSFLGFKWPQKLSGKS